MNFFNQNFHNHCHRDNFSNHVHKFSGFTFISCCHHHCFSGITGPAIRSGTSHVHNFHTVAQGCIHCHDISGVTGEAIPLGNGCHIHCASGVSSFVCNHRHHFQFRTSTEIPI